MNIEFTRTDIKHRRKVNLYTEIVVQKDDEKGFYHTIILPKLYDKNILISTISNQITEFLTQKSLKNQFHILIVGIGNDSLTADSLGPKVVKKIEVNAHLKNLGLPIEGITVSALEPGVLGETGIETKRIVEAVAEEISPDIVILIDSLVTDDPEELTHSIILSGDGLIPGSGLKGLNCEINENTIGCPVLTIGVPTALEVKLETTKKGDMLYLMSPSNIDEFVDDISWTIATALNECFLKDERR